MKYPAFGRLACFLMLAFIALLASGCVYFRLLELKNQLEDFDHNFSIQTDDGVVLSCLQPILLADDLRFLGLEPQDVTADDVREVWHVRWIKDEPTTSSEKQLHDVELFLELQDDKLTQLQIPERYFQFFPKALFVDMLRSTGKATIDKLSRRAEIATGKDGGQMAMAMPALKSVEDMLGVPTERIKDTNTIRYHYRYRTVTPTGRGKAIEMIFHFDLQTGELRRLVGKLPKGTVNFDFPPSTPAVSQAGPNSSSTPTAPSSPSL